tara:strand:- start:5482 stop:5967 length:486 start_codon:yes stop_codon:yes gene_type:complete
MIEENDLRIARWRLSRKGCPQDLLEDYINTAVVCLLEQEEVIEGKLGIGNWLGRVAFYKWVDDRKKLSFRKTRGWPKDNEGEDSEFQGDHIPPDQLVLDREEADLQEKHVMNLIHEGTVMQQDVAHLVARSPLKKGRKVAAIVRGVSYQATAVALNSYRKR